MFSLFCLFLSHYAEVSHIEKSFPKSGKVWEELLEISAQNLAQSGPFIMKSLIQLLIYRIHTAYQMHEMPKRGFQ